MFVKVASIVDISSPIRDGDTPLHVAAASVNNSSKTTKILLGLGAKPTAVNNRFISSFN
jgi:hypothetical protein